MKSTRQLRAVFKQAKTIRTETGKRGSLFHIRECVQCSKEFRIRDCDLRCEQSGGNYCSRACYSEALKNVVGSNHHLYSVETKPCPQCGKPVSLPKSRWSRLRKGRAAANTIHCSRRCAGITRGANQRGHDHPNWRGGHDNYRGSDWHDARREARSRAPFCAICGRMSKLHVHHINPYRVSRDNSQKNLIPLCRKHHKVVEWETDRLLDEGFEPVAVAGIMAEYLRGQQAKIRDWLCAELKRRDSICQAVTIAGYET